MKRIHLVGLVLAAMFAITAVTASAALAAPEWRKEGKELTKAVKFTGKSSAGHMIIEALGVTKIECAADEVKGQAEGTNKVLKVKVTYTGCKAESGGCAVHSPGAGTEEVVTEALDGELSPVAKEEAKSEAGLDLKPETASLFVKVEGSCVPLEKDEVKGSVICEIPAADLNTSKTTGELICTETNKKQTIQKDVGLAKDTLEVFGVEVRLTSTETITFAEAIEVT
jgi:hypothetical protein